MTAECKPVAFDKSIHLQEDGTFLLVIRKDDEVLNIPMKTFVEAQETAAMLPNDDGYFGETPRSVFNPTTKGV